jgi:hypothetical protein
MFQAVLQLLQTVLQAVLQAFFEALLQTCKTDSSLRPHALVV